MKIAISGKGGVGKTTLAGLLARAIALDGKKVLAIDADPDANLAAAIGIPLQAMSALQPLSKMKELAKERTGAGSGYGGLFILNPKVDDLPEMLSVEHEGVRLLMMGTVEHGGNGCVCPEHTLLRNLVQHLLIERDEMLIMDMEAGIEHLGRSTADAVDVLIIVIEPGQRSIQTAHQIEKLASDIGVKHIAYVGSKIKNEADLTFVENSLLQRELLGCISFSEAIRETDRTGLPQFDIGGVVLAEIDVIKTELYRFFDTKNNPGDCHVPAQN